MAVDMGTLSQERLELWYIKDNGMANMIGSSAMLPLSVPKAVIGLVLGPC